MSCCHAALTELLSSRAALTDRARASCSISQSATSNTSSSQEICTIDPLGVDRTADRQYNHVAHSAFCREPPFRHNSKSARCPGDSDGYLHLASATGGNPRHHHHLRHD